MRTLTCKLKIWGKNWLYLKNIRSFTLYLEAGETELINYETRYGRCSVRDS